MNQYADKKQLPMDNDYGQPVDKYTNSVGVQSNRQGTQQNTQRR